MVSHGTTFVYFPTNLSIKINHVGKYTWMVCVLEVGRFPSNFLGPQGSWLTETENGFMQPKDYMRFGGD